MPNIIFSVMQKPLKNACFLRRLTNFYISEKTYQAFSKKSAVNFFLNVQYKNEVSNNIIHMWVRPSKTLNKFFTTEQRKLKDYLLITKYFLAYFLEYYYPHFIRPSVIATTFHGVDRLGRFMGQSIAYGLRTLTKEGFFLGRS
jgi:hypothetical protein